MAKQPETVIDIAWHSARRMAGAFFVLLALGGCAALVPQTSALQEKWPADLPARVELSEVPFFAQRDYQCGPAALAMSLAQFSVPVTTADLIPQVYLPERRGSLQVEMLAAARHYGVVSYQLAPKFEAVLREVAAGTPVIVLQNYGAWPIDIWHYAVVVGYDYPAGDMVLRSGEKERLTMPFPVFEYLWEKSDYWAMVTTLPDRVPATAVEDKYAEAVTALEHAGQQDAAAKAYRALLARWPDDLTALIGLANADHAAGRLKNAEAGLREAATLYPDSVIVLNNLAQTLSDEGRQEEALQWIDRAIALGGRFSSAAAETRALIVERMKVRKPGLTRQ